MPLEGQIDHVSPYKIIGWARDPQAPGQPVRLVVTDNGVDIGRIAADHLRHDLATAHIGTGRHGFELWFPKRLSPVARHVIRVHAEASGAELMYSPAIFEVDATFDEADKENLQELLSAKMSDLELSAAIDYLSQIITDLKRRANNDFVRPEQRLALSGSDVRPHQALIIDDRAPDETRDAGSVAIISHARSLRRLGYGVSFIGQALERSESFSVQAMEHEGITFYYAPRIASVEEVLRCRKDTFDLIYIHRFTNMTLYAPMVAVYQSSAKLVFGLADLHHLRFERQAVAQQRHDLPIEATRRQELYAVAQAACVLTHSVIEVELLRHAVPDANVWRVPWAVAVNKVVRSFDRRRGLAFLGGFSHAPNVSAARRLVDEIMPRVWARNSEIRCILVGPDLPSDFDYPEGVKYVGHVSDLFLPLNRVRLTAAPLTYGAGVKGKVLESMAHGIPCAMSAIAAEGIDLPSPLSKCIADDNEEFAASILALHEDGDLNAKHADAGLEFIETSWSESAVDFAMNLALGEKPRGTAPSGKEAASSDLDVGP